MPVFLWFLFWVIAVLLLYWPGTVIFPKKDHTLLILGRHIADNDFQWFLDMLSYNRTRTLSPGDRFAFRPLLHAIVALEDILFRYRLQAQGVISCIVFAFSTTAFFLLVRRSAGAAVALAVSFLWISQLAGAEIVLWQHINPYLLAPAGLCLAFLLTAHENPSLIRLWLAGISVSIACLTHEIGVLISALLAVAIWRIDRGDRAGQRRLAFLFAVPCALALVWNAIDFSLLHPVTSFMSPDDAVSGNHDLAALKALFFIVGAAGVALLFPGAVHIKFSDNWFMTWPFMNLPGYYLIIGGAAVFLIVAASVRHVVREAASGWRSPDSLVMLLFLLLFFTVFAVTCFRELTRGIGYLFSAPYYFSLFSVALCGMIAVLSSRLSSGPKKYAVALLIAFLALRQGYVLRSTLAQTKDAKEYRYGKITEIREKLLKDRSVCFQGMDSTIIPHDEIRHLSPLFQDVACSRNPSAHPLYLSHRDGRFSLTELRMTERDPSFASHSVIVDRNVQYPGGVEVSSSLISVVDLDAGQTFEFTVRDCHDFGVRIVDENKDDYEFYINNNIVYNSEFDAVTEGDTLTWQPGLQKTTYTVAYSGDSLLLLGNGRLLSIIQHVQLPPGQPVLVQFESGPEHPIRLSNFRAARFPGSTGFVNIERYRF